jgi:ADP-ribose pyrophosphatase YjhB (NUDIX family)
MRYYKIATIPTMEIKSSITNKSGQVYQIIHNDIDDVKEAEGKNVIGVYAYCFYNDKLVIVNENGYTGNPGGGLEKGENVIEGLHREVLEETNMKILQYKPVGIHETIRPGGESVFYIRFACLVEPVGDFKKDPSDDVVGISFIDPSEFVQLCDQGWGEMAEKMLERAVKAKGWMERIKF